MTRIALITVLAAGLVSAAPAQTAGKKSQAVTLAFEHVLPKAFSGWEKQGSSQVLPVVSEADSENAEVLKEYGFNGVESARYQVNGRQLSVKAMRFDDATGGFGAFTFYRQPGMASEALCDGGASDHNHVIFYCGNLLLDVQLDHVTAMTPAELRSLAERLPKASGSAAVPPNLPSFLPESSRPILRFVLGKAGYSKIEAPLDPGLIDFERNPEIAVSRFRALDGPAAATVVEYPTPRIAMQQDEKLEAFARTQQPSNGNLNTFIPRRIGPLVAVVSGEISGADANNFLDRIHYDANLSWSEPTGLEKKNNIGNLVYNILLLAIILFGFSVVVGFAFGGFRVLARRLFPGRLMDRPQDVDFISLGLDDTNSR